MSVPSHSCYIRATAMIGLREFIDTSGGSIEGMLEECGLPTSALTLHDIPICARRLAGLLELASHRLNRPDFALEWAMESEPHYPTAGPMVLIAKLGNTVKHWLDNALRYWSYHTNAFDAVLVQGGCAEQVKLRVSSNMFLPNSRQLVEHQLATMVGMFRAVTENNDLRPAIVRMQHRRPKALTAHEHLFRCSLEFDAEYDEIVFDRKILQMQTRRDLKTLRPLLLRYVKGRLNCLPLADTSMTTSIALIIPSIIGTGRCDIQFVSECLGMSVKKIQRQLAAESTSFSQILELVRQNMAKQHLADSSATIASIAGLLDYSATSPFTLAFRRWTNMSPLAYRQKHRERAHGRASGLSIMAL